MRKLRLLAISVTLFLAFSSSIPIRAVSIPSRSVKVIVGFKGEPMPELVEQYGGSIAHVYHLIPAVAAELPLYEIVKLNQSEEVAYVELDHLVCMMTQSIPWGVDRVDAEIVHFTDNKGAGVRISMLDTGIDYTHPDLDENYKGGYDFVNNDDDPLDENGHGTHIAGIMAAEDNDMGVVGVAPEAHLYAAKVLNRYGLGFVSDVVAGIEWSVDNGIQVISMSLGSIFDSTALHDACDRTYAGGILLVAAAGNLGILPCTDDNVLYPARYGSVIAVGATNVRDKQWFLSSTGPGLELVAPGVCIESTSLDGGYGEKSGTSLACAHVSGVAALVMVSDLSLTNVEVRQRLQETTEDLGPRGFDTEYGHGLVDADGAVRLEWLRGNYITPCPYQYGSAEAEEVLSDLINVNSNYVGLNAYVYQESWNSNEVYLRESQDQPLINMIDDAHRAGLKVSLTVFVLVGDGTWRGNITPSNVNAWFENYTKAVDHYAELAGNNRVELFTIGSELEKLKGYNRRWEHVIRSVTVEVGYRGKISYNQNWWWNDHTFNDVLDCSWFSGLDYIGISGFFELTTEDDPRLDELVAAWSNDAHGRNSVADLKTIAYTFKRLILFTEVGYRNIEGANKHPWDYTADAAVDLQEQADCYEALFRAFHDKPWFRGTLFWAWNTDAEEGGDQDKGYCVRGKPAYETLADWYARIALT